MQLCPQGMGEKHSCTKRGQESEKGARDNPGGLQLPGAGMGWDGFKKAKGQKAGGRNPESSERLQSPCTAIAKGQDEIWFKQSATVQSRVTNYWRKKVLPECLWMILQGGWQDRMLDPHTDASQAAKIWLKWIPSSHPLGYLGDFALLFKRMLKVAMCHGNH